MAAKLFLIASVLLVAVAAPFAVASPLPISLGAQKNMDIHLPEGSTSVTAETINNLSIVFADTVYIMADGTVVPENPTTTVVPPVSTTAPPNGGTGAPVITPPTFPGRK
uniref:DUF4794 domain-containing protein n=1 Tax=Anopheles maculatus TaxID=74869 RepID=A0A182SK20_9DIPT